jgi:glutamate formiminotransferase
VVQPLVECIPNFSEGRRSEVVSEIADALRAHPRVSVLDVESDSDHNRSVITVVAPPEAIVSAMFDAVKTAAELIDLEQHRGAHPRIGATDVVPIVPLRGLTMSDCVALARELGRRVCS